MLHPGPVTIELDIRALDLIRGGRSHAQSQKGSFTRNHKMMFAAINKLFRIGAKLTSIVNEIRVKFHFTSD